MKLLGGDLIILRPEVREPVITDQVKNCLDQLHVICQERKLSKNSFYKFILFLNKTTNNHYDHITRELVSLIKDIIHQDVLVMILYQPPVKYDVVMEVYYYDPEQWCSSFHNDNSGGAVVFKKDSVIISIGYTGSCDGNCRTNSGNTFSSLEMLLSKTGFSLGDIIRQWNYIEGILQYDGPHQHYQIFNEIRAKFYGDHFKEKGYPAGTGIGIKRGGIIVEYIAVSDSETKTIPINNPRQVPAYQYSQDVLKGQSINKVKATPKFERGRYLSVLDKEILFVSGTAAISGEQVIYPDNSSLQTLYTIDTIDELISKNNLNKKGIRAGKSSFDYLRIYMKDRNDFLRIWEVCQKRYGDVPCVWIQADICRNELLVEIEGYIYL